MSVNQAKWLADGRSIVYLESWTAVIFKELENGAERKLYDARATNQALDSLAISPDRKAVAFRDHRQGKIMVALLAGGAPRVATNAKGPASWPAAAIAWSADGRFLIFSDSADHKWHELWRVPVGGGTAERLGLAVDRPITEVAMRPDGRALAIVMPDGTDVPGFYLVERLVPSAAETKSLHPQH